MKTFTVEPVVPTISAFASFAIVQSYARTAVVE
jgi:hypothetical protein